MKGKFLPSIALGAALACGGGSYSTPTPEYTENGNGDGSFNEAVVVVRGGTVSMDDVVDVSRSVLTDEGWTVYRVDRSGDDRVIEARRGSDEMLRIYATPQGGDLSLRGWVQKNGEPQGSPRDILSAIELRLKTGN
jgi:hypothetical protein